MRTGITGSGKKREQKWGMRITRMGENRSKKKSDEMGTSIDRKSVTRLEENSSKKRKTEEQITRNYEIEARKKKTK